MSEVSYELKTTKVNPKEEVFGKALWDDLDFIKAAQRGGGKTDLVAWVSAGFFKKLLSHPTVEVRFKCRELSPEGKVRVSMQPRRKWKLECLDTGEVIFMERKRKVTAEEDPVYIVDNTPVPDFDDKIDALRHGVFQ